MGEKFCVPGKVMLEITLLGEVAVHDAGRLLERFRSQKEVALLAYLAHTGQNHNREALADLLSAVVNVAMSPVLSMG